VGSTPTDEELDAYYGPDGWVRYNGVVYEINDPAYIKLVREAEAERNMQILADPNYEKDDPVYRKAVQWEAELQAERELRIRWYEFQANDAWDAYQAAEYSYLSGFGANASDVEAAEAHWYESERLLEEARNAPLCC